MSKLVASSHRRTTAPRLSANRRKKLSAVGSLIRQRLIGLEILAEQLNRALPPDYVAPEDAFRGQPDDPRAAWAAAREIVEGTADRSIHAPVPWPTLMRFNEIAGQTPVVYQAWRYREKGETVKNTTWEESEVAPIGTHYIPQEALWDPKRPPGQSKTILEMRWLATSPRAEVVALLKDYLMNPQRDRLKRCRQCSRWFVDGTRNKSSLSCSRVCTIKWSNAKRRS
jgi:hypothetical protein